MTTYYVSPTGSNSNAGTSIATAWQTLSKAASTCVAGDTALFLDGTYTGQVVPSTSGTSGSRITFKSKNKWGAKIVESTTHGLNSYGLDIVGDYITVDGFEITAPDDQYGILIEGNFATVQNCWVHDCCNTFNPHSTGGGGIVTYSPNYNNNGNIIRNNRVERIGTMTNGQIVWNEFVHTIYVTESNPTSTGQVTNNLCILSSGNGISIYHNPNNWTVSNNTCINCLQGGLDCWGDVGSGFLADHNTIQNNLFVECGGGSRLYQAFWSPSDACGSHNVFRNCVAWYQGQPVIYDFSPNANQSFSPLQTGTNLLIANPRFLRYKNDGTGDYHLVSGSAAIDAGTSTGAPTTDLDGLPRPLGGGYDVGCYEYIPFTAIGTENQNTGSTGWMITNPANIQIQAYTDKVSYNPGETVSFFVSVPTGGTTYTLNIYRLGYYKGLGGRLIANLGTFTGAAQGYWDGTTLQNCPTAIIDSTTHNCEAGWSVSTTWTIPNTAVTGVYVALFKENATNKQCPVGFVVKGNFGADYAVVRPTTTDQAYNSWGGWSLYTVEGTGVKVSYNRPIWLTTNLYDYEINFIQWVEQQGYNLTYYADIDIHANSALLLNSKAMISTGHDEYWTKERRDGWEAAISAGISSAFLGANPSGWQARLEVDASGTDNRTLVCYKVATFPTPGTLSHDPIYGVDNTRVTSLWRDNVLSRPEDAMVGIMYSGYQPNGITGNFHWTADSSMDTTFTAGTGLVASTNYGTDIVGYEWDKIQTGSPSGVKTIGTTAVTGTGGADTSNTTWYRHASGALVFATGSIGWTNCLNNYRYLNQSSGVAVPQMAQLLANIMGALKGGTFSIVGV
jgi:hypothetical protein